MSTKRKVPTKFAQPALKQSAKQALKANINESNTAVSAIDTHKADVPNGVETDVIEISSDTGSSDYESSDDEQEDQAAIEHGSGAQKEQTSSKDADLIPTQNGGDLDTEMASPNMQAEGESDQEPASPTFGELTQAHETIDVPVTLSEPHPTRAAGKLTVAPPSLASLGTVLSQALRTDDADLLESCLHTTDLTTVRNTIQRLDSSLAGTLLTKLASRMHRRPGRAGSLMAWVQWTLIAHGGALATQPVLIKTLSELNKVLEERSRGLTPLLALKGKLDLLDAQMQLRRSMQQNVDSDDEEEDGEEGIVYVEGQDSEDDMVSGDVDVYDDEGPVTSGIADNDSEDDDEFSEDDDSDEELQVAEEPIDENEVDHDDVEPFSDDDDSEVEAAPPTKKVKKGRR